MYDVYTEVTHHIGWIESSVIANGGMASCQATFTLSPSTGKHSQK